MTADTNPQRRRAPLPRPQSAAARKARLPGKVAGSATKPVSKAAAKPAKKPAAHSIAVAPAVPHAAKPKLVRDSFTIPKSEYSVLEGLKLRAANLTRPAKKSELLRAGIAVLNAMSDQAFLAALNGVPSLKTGRPKGPDAKAA